MSTLAATVGTTNLAEMFSPASSGSVHIFTSASRAELACSEHIPGTPLFSAIRRSRHSSWRTDTLDCLTCVRGEIYLVTDTDEVLIQPGDTVIVRGVNHAWSNRSNEPCLLVGTMTDATPADDH